MFSSNQLLRNSLAVPHRTFPLAPRERVRRNVEQGPRFWGCDRGGAHKHAVHRGAASRSGVASKHNTLGTCSALHVRRGEGQCHGAGRRLPHSNSKTEKRETRDEKRGTRNGGQSSLIPAA